MVVVSYELLDTLTGNFVGVHPTEEEALRSVAEMVRMWGEGAVVNVALARFGPGEESEMIAEGPALAKLAQRVDGPARDGATAPGGTARSRARRR